MMYESYKTLDKPLIIFISLSRFRVVKSTTKIIWGKNYPKW